MLLPVAYIDVPNGVSWQICETQNDACLSLADISPHITKTNQHRKYCAFVCCSFVLFTCFLNICAYAQIYIKRKSVIYIHTSYLLKKKKWEDKRRTSILFFTLYKHMICTSTQSIYIKFRVVLTEKVQFTAVA